jgi:hypothetical protein
MSDSFNSIHFGRHILEMAFTERLDWDALTKPVNVGKAIRRAYKPVKDPTALLLLPYQESKLSFGH